MVLKVNNTEGCHDHHSHGKTLTRRYYAVLSVAGSDSSGGAGIQADLKTLSALGVYGATAITAITAQNTEGVHSQFTLPPQMVYDQIRAVIDDIRPLVIKIGMLSTAEVASAVADALTGCSIPIILDPVMVSSSGHRLLSVEAQEVVKQRLLPMSLLLTPNIPEMEALTRMPLSTLAERECAARHLLALGAKAVLLKGGHEEGDIKRDILYQERGNMVTSTYLSTPTVYTKNIHGTGCTLSSAIAAYMARGDKLEEAVARAKEYISKAIEAGADISIGRGFGPVNHLFNPLKMGIYEEYEL